MPRDKDKNNAPRGGRGGRPPGRDRGEGPRGGKGPHKGGGKTEGRSFAGRGERDERRSSGDRKPYGDRKPSGDRKSFGEGKSFSERKSFGERKPYGERKSFGEGKSFGERKSFGDRKPSGDRKSFGEGKSFSERKSFGERKPYGERKSFGEGKSFGERKSFGDRKPSGDRKSFGEGKSFSERKSFGERKPYGERKSFGEGKSFGERKSFGDRKPSGERKPYGEKGAGEGFRARDDRPRRFERDGDRPDRGPRKDFAPRGERGGEERPRFKPRQDRNERPARAAGETRRFDDKRGFGEKRGEGRRDFGKGGFRHDRDGDKPFARGPRLGREDFAGRDRSEEKPWQRREAGSRDEARGERRFDRPRQDREGGFSRGERRFDRPREERGPEGRGGFARPRGERKSWQEHPRGEGGFERGGRPERRGPGEGDDAKIFPKRPAFGGRGAYRERKPEDHGKRDHGRRDHGKKDLGIGVPPPNPDKSGERIAKRLARAGLCSRRDAEAWIAEGRVTVNGNVLTSPALDVADTDTILVDGKPLPEPERTRLFLYHKPRGLMTTHSDPEGRPTVFDHLPEGLPRLISVGRLDFNTEGLLLLTNDGGLARALELPDTGWLRRYRVRAHGEITQAQLDTLRGGVEVDGVKYGPIEAELERDQGSNVWLVVAIREGKNREVRNVLAHLGLEVNRLIRVSYGPFQLAELPEGEVEEVRTRVLRDQLGDKIANFAGVDFEGPKAPFQRHEGDDGGAAPRRGDKAREPRSDRARSKDFKSKDFKPRDSKPRDFKSRDFDSRDSKPRDFKSRDHKSRDFKDRDFKDRDSRSKGFKSKGPDARPKRKERDPDAPVVRKRAAEVEDRKGRRVLVERSGDGDREARPYRRPNRTYHGKREHGAD
ncbi:pseudouridine synthase [Bradyrhizobium sp. WD16]|uniref:pseudouridine synthase n=1 Tax=Bradyrhizobium sp. WD16 TaxID=1521768 RepID=UPI0020A518F7|nr:pseudouridine synthase [Bradyrhizobium sp. WD16]UTD27680.1 pseudouridine synthase [Bradyrhizobium sp. WD16]